MEIGVFEAIPLDESIGISELAEKCEADESLISTHRLSSKKWVRMLTNSSPTDETADLGGNLHRAQAGTVGAQSSVCPLQHSPNTDR